MKFYERKSFILTIRFLGWIYYVVFLLNTLFFYDQYLYKTPLSSGIFGIISFYMMTYKEKNLFSSLKRRIIAIIYGLIMLTIICFIIIQNS